MRLYEFTDEAKTNKIKLVGLLKQFQGRIEDTNADEPASLEAILGMLSAENIHLTADQFRQMASEPPISNIVSNVRGDRVVFKGQTDEPEKMNQDDASKTLDKMAKRAAKNKEL